MIWLLAGLLLLTQPVINAENITRLESVLHLDFSELAAHDLRPGSGVFVVNEDESVVVTFATAEGESPLSTAVIWDGITGDLRDTVFIGENQLDRALLPGGGILLVARYDGADIIDIATGESLRMLVSDAPVLSVWSTLSGGFCGETQESVVCNDGRAPMPVLGDDSGEFARIGRVPPPLAVTVSEKWRG